MITIYTGPMFSGKTQALMARLQSKQRAHRNVLVVKPALDNRYDSVDEIVVHERRHVHHLDRHPCGNRRVAGRGQEAEQRP